MPQVDGQRPNPFLEAGRVIARGAAHALAATGDVSLAGLSFLTVSVLNSASNERECRRQEAEWGLFLESLGHRDLPAARIFFDSSSSDKRWRSNAADAIRLRELRGELEPAEVDLHFPDRNRVIDDAALIYRWLLQHPTGDSDELFAALETTAAGSAAVDDLHKRLFFEGGRGLQLLGRFERRYLL